MYSYSTYHVRHAWVAVPLQYKLLWYGTWYNLVC